MEETRNNTPSQPAEDDSTLFERVSLVWILSLFAAFALAVFEHFSKQNIWILSGATVLGTIASLRKLRPSRELLSVGIAVFLVAVVSTSFSDPTVFSGRDQGSYANAAIRLATSGSIESRSAASDTFFAIYGPGKALNFPGFFYTEKGALTPQFPLGSIVWFSANFQLFGLAGFSLANTFTLFLSVLGIFLLLRRFLPLHFSLLGSSVAFFSFPFLWITENTLSENLAGALFILLAFALVSFVQTPSRIRFALLSLGGTFLFLTRIEGIALFPVALALPFFFPQSRIFLKERIFSNLLLAVSFFALAVAASLTYNMPFYRTIGKAIFGSPVDMPASADTTTLSSIFESLARSFELFWIYGMISVFAMALLGTIILIKSKRFVPLIPLFLALPTFLYFFGSHISADHPWELRRFVPTVWPTLVILSAFGIFHLFASLRPRFPESFFFRPLFFSAFATLLLVTPALPSVIPALAASEHSRLLDDTKIFSEALSDRDLVLVDRLATGDPYAMIADPLATLFGKSAVYFFNPSDIGKLDASKFERILLLAREEDIARYRDALGETFPLQSLGKFSFRTQTFSRETDPGTLPSRMKTTTTGELFLVEKISK